MGFRIAYTCSNGESGDIPLLISVMLTSASTLLWCNCACISLNFLNFGLIGAICWKMISSEIFRSIKAGSLMSSIMSGLRSSCWSFCDNDVVDGGDGGVCLGDGPLHCISRRQCSARAISAANHDGNSGKSHVNADRKPSIMCSSVTIRMTVCVDVRPGQSRDTWPDRPISAQFTMTAANPRTPNAFCQVPMLATRWPNGRCARINITRKVGSLVYNM